MARKTDYSCVRFVILVFRKVQPQVSEIISNTWETALTLRCTSCITPARTRGLHSHMGNSHTGRLPCTGDLHWNTCTLSIECDLGEISMEHNNQ